jgi:hypothetical protein
MSKTSIRYRNFQSLLARIPDVAKLFLRREISKFILGFTTEKDPLNVVNAIRSSNLLATRGTMKEDIQMLNHTNACIVQRIIIEDICLQFT